jgi:hypothetical protein
MRRLLAIAVIGAAALFPASIEAQLRSALGIRVPPTARGAVPFASPMRAPVLRTRVGGTPLRFAPPGPVILTKPGLHGGFAPRRFSSRHLVSRRNLGFFFNRCLSIFNPFFCHNFFFLHRFAAFSPLFSAPIIYPYPVFYPKAQAYPPSTEPEDKLAQEVDQLRREIQQLREEEMTRQRSAESQAAPQPETRETEFPQF